MKRILLFILCVFCFNMTGCQNNISTSSSKNNSSSSISKTSDEKLLIEGVDYVDHSMTFNKGEFIFDESMWYINDLNKVPLPDPHVFFEDGVYYITGTNDYNEGRTIDCYVTEDFVSYHKIELYNPARYNGWESVESPQIYAPEIYHFGDEYYLYYSANDNLEKPVRRNSVLVSSNPAGPYRPIQNDKVNGYKEPIFNFDKTRGLDVTIFQDDNGDLYMYYVVTEDTQHIVGVKLNSPYEADWTTRKVLVLPGTIDSESDEILLEWETYRESSLKIAEAPYMIKSNNKYYLTYSVNGCWNKYYNVCYAVSSSPLGNFVKPYEEGKLWSNLLLGYPGTPDENDVIYDQWTGFASGTGHHCFFNIGEQIMIGYHAHQNRSHNDVNKYTERYFAFDYVHFDENGVPFCNGPTNSIQPLPEELSGFKNIALSADVDGDNVTNIKAINDKYIVDCYNLDDSNREVILGKGRSYIDLSFDNEYTIGGVAIYNSAYFGKIIEEIEYIDFGNDNVVYYPQFSKEAYVNVEKSFINPCSAFTIEFPKTFKSNKMVICIDSSIDCQLNEIIVLGK